MLEDTIAAIATPPGVGGIAVVRVSGPLAESIFHNLFRPKRPSSIPESHHLYHGDIVCPESGLIIDEVLTCLMRGPNSYTGEDVLEIHGHGGHILPQKVLSAVIRAGARPAAAGEFTRRAFLNGRMDLSQAEAVAELMTAQTDRGMDMALAHLKGDLRRTAEKWIDGLTDCLAYLEAAIEFSEDGIEDPSSHTAIAEKLRNTAFELGRLASTFDMGKIFLSGVRVVIAGRANVGKSSLLNRLLGEKRAIVTSAPGTTRDFIEEPMDLSGIAVRLTDTAGIRETSCEIEQAGIDLVWEKVDAADAVLILLDGSEPLRDEDRQILIRCKSKPVLAVVNKEDLPRVLCDNEITVFTDGPPVWISAKYDIGIDALKAALHRRLVGAPQAASDSPAVTITNLRHRIAIEKAEALISQAAVTVASGVSYELAVADIHEAVDSLGEISGRTLTDAVLDRIFSTFCIGK
ncbi:MAG: tRNA modification GTPase MnmE [Syntrophus sp. SKADARSKE-3]|nr:tRNA modification GTPase MnmE [Syntrophus sp. SKADARSKE-3]